MPKNQTPKKIISPVLTRAYIKFRIDRLKALAKEKRESEQEQFLNQLPLEATVTEPAGSIG